MLREQRAGGAGAAAGGASTPRYSSTAKRGWLGMRSPGGACQVSSSMARPYGPAGSGSSSVGGSPARTGWPNSGHASLRHSQSCSGPPSASLAGWPQVGQMGGPVVTSGFLSPG